jgi:hypothetical protein
LVIAALTSGRRGILSIRYAESTRYRTPASAYWTDIVAECCKHARAGRLSAKDREVVAELMVSVIGYDGVPTARQAAWLKSIHTRLQREGRAAK